MFDISISEQALSDRLQKTETQTFLKELISEAMLLSPHFPDMSLEIAKQFNGIYAGDCTSITLPDERHDEFPGKRKSIQLRNGVHENIFPIRTFQRPI